jgi:hypothetical protein
MCSVPFETFRVSSGEAELVATGREEILAELISGIGECSIRVVRCYDVWSLVCRAKSSGCPGIITAR